ncbi:hypothetical protein JCM8097_001645 [Rhodosporidiobolus ruineniae]
MDPDPHFYASHLADDAPAPEPVAAPLDLSTVSLPSPLRPSLSPSVSRVFQRPANDKAPRMSGGLDLNAPASPGAPAGFVRSGAGGGIEDDIARARAERASRLASSRTSSYDDPRDAASARENIQNLVSAGQRALGGSSSGAPPSLAMFMGGGAGRRVHKVNDKMTDAEREETERLEKEMAATRAKWGDKGAAAAGPPAGGMSLASLMMGGKTPSKPPASSSSPSSTPAEALPQPVSPPLAASSDEPALPPSPPLVEAKLVSIPPPAQPLQTLPSPPKDDFQPSSRSATAGDTLTRLRSSSIVADRLKWSEEKQKENTSSSSPAPSLPGSPTKTDKADKRRSVLDRWGRDEPNLVGEAALKSPPLGSSPWSPKPAQQQQSPKPSPALGSHEQQEQELGKTASPALIGVAKVEEVEVPEEPVAAGVAPKLVHVTRDRPRPTKSTPRTQSSSISQDVTSSPAATAESASSPSPAAAEPAPPKNGYTKPTWSAAPIGVKEPSRPSSVNLDYLDAPDEPAEPEVKHTRGVALPGLSSAGSLRPTPARSQSIPAASPAPVPASEPVSRAETPITPGRPSVKGVASRWGAALAARDADAEKEKEDKLRALKASYGVRVESAPASPVKSRSVLPEPKEEVKPQPKPVFEPPKAAPVPVVAPAPAAAPSPAPAKPSPVAAQTKTASSVSTPKPSLISTPASKRSDALLSLVFSPAPLPHLPPGETIGLDVFHLNSPSDDPHPIEHNFMLFRNEILGIVHRSAPHGASEGEVVTSVWVWQGDEAKETRRTQERVRKLREKTGVEPVWVGYRQEPPALVEAFANQVTICKGNREEFDHLANRLYSVQQHDGVVYVEETDLTARSLCSGYSAVFSSNEVFAWLGAGSTDAERHAACEFAEAIADGRTVTVCAEGEETALMWHSLDGLEYSSAYYWRYRSLHPQHPLLLRFDSSISPLPTPIPSLDLSLSHVQLLDGGFAEHWVLVPELAKGKKEDIRRAIEAARELSQAWEERDFPARTPYHILTFPTLIPRDLPFLSRQLDFAPLNAGSTPTRMHVYTADEAKEELL